MRPDDAGRLAQSLYRLGLAVGRQLDEPTVDVYFDALADLPIVAVVEACHGLERTSERMPAPSVIRAAVGELRRAAGYASHNAQLRLDYARPETTERTSRLSAADRARHRFFALRDELAHSKTRKGK